MLAHGDLWPEAHAQSRTTRYREGLLIVEPGPSIYAYPFTLHTIMLIFSIILYHAHQLGSPT